VRRLLTTLSELDPLVASRPMAVPCMHSKNIQDDRWHFAFCQEPMTLTTFAPFYPATSSRYAFRSHADSSFVLFQPESSFAWYDSGKGLTRDETCWHRPTSARERIRVAYKNAGREYDVATHSEGALPAARHVVRPIRLDGPNVEWWKVPIAACERTSAIATRTDHKRPCNEQHVDKTAKS